MSVPIGVEDQKRIEELRIENERLRRIVTDLLLEKAKVEEQVALNFRGKSLRRNSIRNVNAGSPRR